MPNFKKRSCAVRLQTTHKATHKTTHISPGFQLAAIVALVATLRFIFALRMTIEISIKYRSIRISMEYRFYIDFSEGFDTF